MPDERHVSELVLTLGGPPGFSVSAARANSLGPLLQGALMEHVGSDYAAWLHAQPFNPYSQRCAVDKRSGLLVWRIAALDDEAMRQILLPLQAASSFELRGAGVTLEVRGRSFASHSLKSVTDQIASNGAKGARIEFVSPAAFKSGGEYVVMPSIRLMFQNLLMRYGQAYGQDHEADQDTVDFIEQNVQVRSYNLCTRRFDHVDRRHGVTGFVGELELAIKKGAPQPLTGLVHMLLRFGEFSGVGIKTSMGMGGMRCL